VEFKETLQEEALHTVGAFANVRGGALLLGVNDAGVFVGVDVGKVTLRDLNLARVRRYMTLATNVGRRSFEPGTKPREVVEKLELVRGGHPTTWTSILLFGSVRSLH
jgi:predicted HTH transcriptional regulator